MLQFAGECKDGALEPMRKVRWSDEQWGIRVRREADPAQHLLYQPVGAVLCLMVAAVGHVQVQQHYGP